MTVAQQPTLQQAESQSEPWNGVPVLVSIIMGSALLCLHGQPSGKVRRKACLQRRQPDVGLDIRTVQERRVHRARQVRGRQDLFWRMDTTSVDETKLGVAGARCSCNCIRMLVVSPDLQWGQPTKHFVS